MPSWRCCASLGASLAALAGASARNHTFGRGDSQDRTIVLRSSSNQNVPQHEDNPAGTAQSLPTDWMNGYERAPPRCKSDRDGRNRPGAVLRNDAGRHGRRRHPYRAAADRMHGPAGAARRAGPAVLRCQCARQAYGPCRTEGAGWAGQGTGSGRTGRCADRGISPGRDGKARPGARSMPGAQSAAGLRPRDRMGPARAVGKVGRPRPELHRRERTARRHGTSRGIPCAAAEPARRIRRRRHDARVRHCLRAAGSPAERHRPGHRCRDERWQRIAGGDALRPESTGRLDHAARQQPV
ncbi:hypothetical protein D3C81_1198260 [compost metagenome]